MKRYEVKLVGIEPGLLMNRFSIEDEAQADKNHRKSKIKPTMQDELERAAYRKQDGELYIPSEWVFQSLLKAAGEYSIPGRGKKTFRDVIKSTIVFEPDQIGLGTKKYSVDARPVVIRATKGRIVRYRPHLPKWSINFCLTILDEDMIDAETLNTILVRAGQIVGVGDYRPRYGRFLVERFAEIKPKKEKAHS
jgi:hypothetical protein